MHHTPSLYGAQNGGVGLDTDGYGQTPNSLASGDGSEGCSYFNAQANVISDSWAVSYTSGLSPMKQMEGESKGRDRKAGGICNTPIDLAPR